SARDSPLIIESRGDMTTRAPSRSARRRKTPSPQRFQATPAAWRSQVAPRSRPGLGVGLKLAHSLVRLDRTALRRSVPAGGRQERVGRSTGSRNTEALEVAAEPRKSSYSGAPTAIS